MKHVKKFEGFKNNKPEVKIENKVNETVFQVENLYRVQVIADVEGKLLSAYAKKVKQNMNKDITDLMGNAQLAEEIVKWVLKDGLDADKIPASAIIGGAQSQAQGQSQAQDVQGEEPQAQVQVQAQPQGQAQAQPQGQAQAQPQGQAQGQGQDMEEVQTQSDEDELPA